MECNLCGKSTYVYTGVINPWYECNECGALYCDNCVRGHESSGPGYASPEQLYQISRTKTCIRCDGNLYKYDG